MPRREEEHKTLVREGEAREAGVADLLDFYGQVENIYAASATALEEQQIGVTTSATNPTS